MQRTVVATSRRTHDIVFPTEKVAIDVHGCFWHGCPIHYVPPKTNADFWADKVRVNRQRDVQTHEMLESEGWTHVVVWEHEDPEAAADRIADQVLSCRFQINVSHPLGTMTPDIAGKE